LSADGAQACASCHTCEKGLTDGAAPAAGARNSPSLWNIGYHSEFNWDGRNSSLEAQAQTIWRELMGAQNREAEIVARLNAVGGYQQQFKQVFGGAANAENIAQALAAYERTFISGNDETPFDRWQAGDEAAVSEQVKRGYQIFQQARCNQCHAAPLFTDLQYHNVGIGADAPGDKRDQGRFAVLEHLPATDSQRLKFTGAFKTPTLRDVAKSAPYFHDGSVATLAEAVEVMLNGGRSHNQLDTKLPKTNLSASQKEDLLEFLRALSNDKCRVTAPQLP
jgi:cytochrome c peroxidase